MLPPEVNNLLQQPIEWEKYRINRNNALAWRKMTELCHQAIVEEDGDTVSVDFAPITLSGVTTIRAVTFDIDSLHMEELSEILPFLSFVGVCPSQHNDGVVIHFCFNDVLTKIQ